MTVDREELRRLCEKKANSDLENEDLCAIVAAFPDLVDELDAADERMAGVLDGTFALGDGTAAKEIERCRARIAELESTIAAIAVEVIPESAEWSREDLLCGVARGKQRIKELEVELTAATEQADSWRTQAQQLTLRLSIATELNVGDRKRIAELESQVADTRAQLARADRLLREYGIDPHAGLP